MSVDIFLVQEPCFSGIFHISSIIPPWMVYICSSSWLLAVKYRVSHGKVNKVIWLCWGYSFWFLLIFCVLWVHEKGTFMPNSPVFIFLMLGAFYRMICKNTKSFFGKNSLHVSNVKLVSIFFFYGFGFFMPFWWE